MGKSVSRILTMVKIHFRVIIANKTPLSAAEENEKIFPKT
jgi:hypothetical protein